ncbi:MAG: DUF3426 domain-containing protein [Luteimonas sp.]
MFINCPNCSALVATDLATDLPPERCPRCGFGPLIEQVDLKAPAPAPSPDPTGDTAPEPETPPVPEPKTPPTPEPETPPSPVAPEAPAPEPPPEAAPEPAPTAEPPAPEPAPQRPPAEPDASVPAAEAGPPIAAERPAPRFLRRRGATAGVRPGRRQVAVAAGLALLLVVQLLLADRTRLATDTGWRPLVATLCGVLRCTLPAWREPAAIAVEQRDVRPLPDRPGVLRVSATIRNDARWAQAWPRLTLTLSDVNGRALGMRAFQPAEYLTAPPDDVTMASGQSAAIRMDIVEPSPHAVAFNFSFQ